MVSFHDFLGGERDAPHGQFVDASHEVAHRIGARTTLQRFAPIADVSRANLEWLIKHDPMLRNLTAIEEVAHHTRFPIIGTAHQAPYPDAVRCEEHGRGIARAGGPLFTLCSSASTEAQLPFGAMSVPATALIRLTTLWFAILIGLVVFPFAERLSKKVQHDLE